jgi:recombination protein RecA
VAAKEEPKKKLSVSDVLKKASKDYGLRVGSLNDVVEDVKAFSSGNLGIDTILGVGGIPQGRMIEVFGPPSSGKTTTALQAAVQMQRIIKAGGDPRLGIAPDDVILYLDYENSMDPVYVANLGLDVEHPSFLITQPDTLEVGADLGADLTSTGKCRLSIWDSVASMSPSKALEAESGRQAVAEQARLMSQFLRKFNPILANNNSTAIFVNHLMTEIPMGQGGRPGVKKDTTPGGMALKYFSSVRLKYQQIEVVKGKIEDELTGDDFEAPVATNVKVSVVKNKVGPPFRSTVVRVRYGKGFDNFWTAMQVLTARKVIPTSQGYWYFEKQPALVHEDMGTSSTGRRYIRGMETLFEFADSHLDWREAVIKEATALIGGQTVVPELATEETPEPDAREEEPNAADLVELLEGPAVEEPKPEEPDYLA